MEWFVGHGPGRWVTRSRARWTLCVIAVVVITRLPALVVSFANPDEATYSALGARIAAGFTPYAGAIDHKPPGVALIYAAVYAIAGRYHLIAVRVVLLAVVALTALALGQLAVHRRGEPAARIAGLAYAAASVLGVAEDGQAANTELFAALPLVLAGVALARGGIRRAALAGVLVGLATLIRYQSGLVGAAFAVAVAVEAVRAGAPRAALGRLAGLALGFAAVAVGFLAGLRAAGALQPYWFWGWGYNFIYIAVLTPIERVINAVTGTATIALCWIPLFCVIRRPRGALELAWLVAALLGVATGGRFYLHYYLAVLPPLCLAADAARFRPRALVAFAAAIAIALVLGFGKDAFAPARARDDRAYREIARAVAARARPDQTVFVWGDSPEIYHYADRLMASRFAFCNYHTGRVWGSRYVEPDATGTESYIVPRAMPELLEDLAAAPPAVIVDGGAGHLNRYELHPIARYPELAHWLAEHYRLDEIVAGTPIYVRR